jgi:hypothetical protein
MPREERKLISVRVPVPVFEELERRAQYDGRKVSPLASLVLSRFAFPGLPDGELVEVGRRRRAAAGARRR